MNSKHRPTRQIVKMFNPKIKSKVCLWSLSFSPKKKPTCFPCFENKFSLLRILFPIISPSLVKWPVRSRDYNLSANWYLPWGIDVPSRFGIFLGDHFVRYSIMYENRIVLLTRHDLITCKATSQAFVREKEGLWSLHFQNRRCCFHMQSTFLVHIKLNIVSWVRNKSWLDCWNRPVTLLYTGLTSAKLMTVSAN